MEITVKQGSVHIYRIWHLYKSDDCHVFSVETREKRPEPLSTIREGDNKLSILIDRFNWDDGPVPSGEKFTELNFTMDIPQKDWNIMAIDERYRMLVFIYREIEGAEIVWEDNHER